MTVEEQVREIALRENATGVELRYDATNTAGFAWHAWLYQQKHPNAIGGRGKTARAALADLERVILS